MELTQSTSLKEKLNKLDDLLNTIINLKGSPMKQFFLIAFALFGFVLTQAQSVNDVPISDIDAPFIEILGTARLLSKKVTIEIDFGQEVKMFGGMDQIKIRDGEGKNVVFNSMIDALNFFSSNGYKFEQAYTVTEGNQLVYHYLMSKK